MRKLGLLAAFLAVLLGAAPASAEESCQLTRIAVIPFQTDETARPYIPATLEGRATHLMLGTGEFLSFLHRSAVKEFDLHTVSGNSIARVTNFKLGGIPFGTAVDFLIDNNETAKSIEKDGGILGLNLLTHYDLEIDNAAKTISLFTEDHCSGAVVYWADEALSLAIDKLRRPKILGTEVRQKDYKNQIIFPVARVVIEGKEALALFNTASAHTIVDVHFARDHLRVRANTPGVTPEASRGSSPRYSYTFKSFNVSGMAFANMPAKLSLIEGVDVIFGMNELKKLRLYFAFNDGMIHITAADANRGP